MFPGSTTARQVRREHRLGGRPAHLTLAHVGFSYRLGEVRSQAQLQVDLTTKAPSRRFRSSATALAWLTPGADQEPVLRPRHPDSGWRRIRRRAIENIPGTRRAVRPQNKVPPVLAGLKVVERCVAGAGKRKGNEVGADRQLLDADVLPAGRQVRLEQVVISCAIRPLPFALSDCCRSRRSVCCARSKSPVIAAACNEYVSVPNHHGYSMNPPLRPRPTPGTSLTSHSMLILTQL